MKMKMKMMKKKMKNQQWFSDDLQQTKTNSDSNGEPIESEISETVPSSSSSSADASASCSPVSVLELSPAAPILNSDKDAKDSAVITTEHCNAELNRNESAMAGLENDNQKESSIHWPVCGSAATDHAPLGELFI